MYAIVATSGRQYRIEEGQNLVVDRRSEEVGTEITLDRVLLVDDDGDVKIGQPTIEGAQVKAKIADHHKGDKVLTFKYKRRKRSRVRKGFRASLTTLEILGIQG